MRDHAWGVIGVAARDMTGFDACRCETCGAEARTYRGYYPSREGCPGEVLPNPHRFDEMGGELLVVPESSEDGA